MSSPAELSEHVGTVSNLADGDLARGNLPCPEEHAQCQLADAHAAEASLSEAQQYSQTQLADGDDAERKLANRDNTVRKTADGEDAAGRDPLTCFWAQTIRVMDERQIVPRAMRFELGETVAGRVNKPPPYTARRFLDVVLNLFEEQISRRR